MINQVRKTIKRYDLLERGERVLVAFSGGPDSTALLALLDSLAKELDLVLIAAHYNHGLRGEDSDGDEKFSRDFAESRGLVFVSDRMDRTDVPGGVSPEDFYRRKRYGFLEKAASDYGAQKIALGHNLQDQAETVLLNLLRGSGSEGLRGFLPKRDGKIVRPLIEISRREIIDFLNHAGIPYRRDSSNEDRMYLRNRVRAELIPYLKENYNPGIEANLARTAEILRTENAFIEQQVAEALATSFVQRIQNGVMMETDFVGRLPEAVRLRLFKTILEDFNPAKNGVSFTHIKSLNDLWQKHGSCKHMILPFDTEARREYDHLILERREAGSGPAPYEYTVPIPSSLYIRERNFNIDFEIVKKASVAFNSKNRIYLDLDRIQQPLVIRNRKDGDWFRPLGAHGRQKIKKYFIDHKVPVRIRNEMMLVADGLSVIYIENMHLDERVKITAQTKKVLKMEITSP